MYPPCSAYFETLHRSLLETVVTTGLEETLTLEKGLSAAVDLLLQTRAAGGKALLMGNGGSAAIVSHLHNDLCKSLRLRALVFNEAPLLTALANDHGYECAFERPVQLWAEPGDLVVAVSSSGQSASILRPVAAALERGCRVITFTGFGADNPLRGRGDLNFFVPATAYGFVEVAHTALCHYLTDAACGLA